MNPRPNNARPRRKRRNPGQFGLPLTPCGCRFAIKETLAANGRSVYEIRSLGASSGRGR